MRVQTKIKEKNTKNISCDNIVRIEKYDFMKNLAQLRRTLRFPVILMAQNPPKISSLNVVSRFIFKVILSRFTSFPFPVDACPSFSKMCQTVAGSSMTSQFHELLNLIFGGFLLLLQLCGAVRGGWLHRTSHQRTHMGYVICALHENLVDGTKSSGRL